MRVVLIGLLAAAALLSQSPASAEVVEKTDAAAAFARLQSLAGEWEAPLGKGEVMIDIFRPMAFGTALLHEEWKNGEQLTATVFYVVGSELHADHFCDMGNQLHYVAAPSTDTDTFSFSLRDASNLDTHPKHFHSTTWHIESADHLLQDWEIVTPGKDPKVIRLDFKRK
jgi:hypothetical protein